MALPKKAKGVTMNSGMRQFVKCVTRSASGARARGFISQRTFRRGELFGSLRGGESAPVAAGVRAVGLVRVLVFRCFGEVRPGACRMRILSR